MHIKLAIYKKQERELGMLNLHHEKSVKNESEQTKLQNYIKYRANADFYIKILTDNHLHKNNIWKCNASKTNNC